MQLVDSQIHVWAEDTPERPWDPTFGAHTHGPPELLPETVLGAMDAAGVDAALLVPPSFEGDRNDVSLAAVKAHPDRFLMHARFNVSSPEVRAQILATLAEPGVRGIRLTFNAAARSWIEDGTIDWFWAFAAEQGIPVSLYPYGEQLQLLGSIAARHPGLKLSIDHLATSIPDTGYDKLDRIRELEPLAAHPNIAVKASALTISFPATYAAARVREVVDLLLPWYGAERIFWGSDLSRTVTPTDYGDSVEVFLSGISHLPASEQELIMGAGLRQWFGWQAGP